MMRIEDIMMQAVATLNPDLPREQRQVVAQAEIAQLEILNGSFGPRTLTVVVAHRTGTDPEGLMTPFRRRHSL